jgi:hypothetical protein
VAAEVHAHGKGREYGGQRRERPNHRFVSARTQGW